MYHVKPINNSNVEIEFPTSMYRIKSSFTDRFNENSENNLNNCNVSVDVSQSRKNHNRDIVQQIDNILKQSTNDNMEKLELRQEIIVKQLNELKERLLSMHKEMNICSKSTQQPILSQTTPKQKPIDIANLNDIVIHANPAYVPFSLFTLQKLWTERLTLRTQFFTHSTISNLPKTVLKLQNLSNSQTGSNKLILNITIIWKKIERMEMIIGCSLPIIGESNILRHLSRIGPNEFNYELNGLNCNEVDSQLDLSESLILASNQKERQVILKKLNSILGKNEYFGGSSPSVSDFCLASSVVQCCVEKEIPPPLLKWSRRVNDVLN